MNLHIPWLHSRVEYLCAILPCLCSVEWQIFKESLRSPAEELYITIVGPLTSLFLGAVFLVWGTGGFHTLGINIPVTLHAGRAIPNGACLAGFDQYYGRIIQFDPRLPHWMADGSSVL